MTLRDLHALLGARSKRIEAENKAIKDINSGKTTNNTEVIYKDISELPGAF